MHRGRILCTLYGAVDFLIVPSNGLYGVRNAGGAMIFLVIEACKSGLLGQGQKTCEPLLNQVASILYLHCSNHLMHSLQGQYLGYPCLLSGALSFVRRKIRVQTVYGYTVCTVTTAGVNRIKS
jgi:hypothetical protein